MSGRRAEVRRSPPVKAWLRAAGGALKADRTVCSVLQSPWSFATPEDKKAVKRIEAGVSFLAGHVCELTPTILNKTKLFWRGIQQEAQG